MARGVFGWQDVVGLSTVGVVCAGGCTSETVVKLEVGLEKVILVVRVIVLWLVRQGANFGLGFFFEAQPLRLWICLLLGPSFCAESVEIGWKAMTCASLAWLVGEVIFPVAKTLDIAGLS